MKTEATAKNKPKAEIKASSTKNNSKSKPKSFNWRPILKKVLKIIILAALTLGAIIGTQYLSAWLIRLVVPQTALSSPVTLTLYSVISYLLALVVLLCIVPQLGIDKRPNRDELGLHSYPTWTDIGLAPIGYIISIIFASILTALFSLLPWFNANETQVTGFSIFMSAPERILAFVILVIIAPITEELIFRGWLYGKLKHFISAPLAILITSLLFAAVHGQWNVGVTVFALSIILCLQREITGTIYSGILLHMIKNGIAFYLLYVMGFGI